MCVEPPKLLCLQPQVSLVTLDLSFISVLKVMPAVAQLVAPGAQLVVLVKPQFEAGRSQVGSGGVVKDPKVRSSNYTSAALALLHAALRYDVTK
jgi:23S rRNA (cytidine1920-2'-O)/16S rRNA (cytidine1409-2'-O)-methyltransferase